MTDEKLIAAQARRIAELEKLIEQYRNSNSSIKSLLVCVGGPLNDNKLGYTKEQLGPFFRIDNLLVEEQP